MGRNRRRRAGKKRSRPAEWWQMWAFVGAGVLVVAGAVVAIVIAVTLGGEGLPEAPVAVPPTAQSLGDAGAPVTVIEFADFQ